MAAMDTFMPWTRTGNFAPCRAGGFAGNHLIHSSFIPAKSASSRRMTVALTTRSRELPAALRMADTFSRHCLVCSWIVSPTIFPVPGSYGPIPETNTSPAARTAWLYAGGGDGAFGVRMMSLAINDLQISSHSESYRGAYGRLAGLGKFSGGTGASSPGLGYATAKVNLRTPGGLSSLARKNRDGAGKRFGLVVQEVVGDDDIGFAASLEVGYCKAAPAGLHGTRVGLEAAVFRAEVDHQLVVLGT